MSNDDTFQKEDVYLAVGKTVAGRVGVGELDSYTRDGLTPAFMEMGLNPPAVLEHIDTFRQQREEREGEQQKARQRTDELERLVQDYEQKVKKQQSWQSFGEAVSDVLLYVPRKIGDGISYVEEGISYGWNCIAQNGPGITLVSVVILLAGTIANVIYDEVKELDYQGRAIAVAALDISDQEKEGRLRAIVTEALDHYKDLSTDVPITPEHVVEAASEYFSTLRHLDVKIEEGIQLLDCLEDFDDTHDISTTPGEMVASASDYLSTLHSSGFTTGEGIQLLDYLDKHSRLSAGPAKLFTSAAAQYVRALAGHKNHMEAGLVFLSSAYKLIPCCEPTHPSQLVDSAITIMRGK